MNLLAVSILVAFFLHVSVCTNGDDNETMALKYLNQYGYLSHERSGNHDVSTAIRNFQEFFGLKVSGTLDSETVDLMKKPRCGVSDDSGGGTRKRRYATLGRWSKTDLTYYVQPGQDLPPDQQRQIFREALQFWADVSGLTFREIDTASASDIKISFGRYGHEGTDAERTCPYPFDGSAGTLAHAYFPQDGRAHFDEDETFTHGTPYGVNLLWVAVHEFGHSLGLQHSSTYGAIMYPYYTGYVPNMKLHFDDVAGIQSLYGDNTETHTEIHTEIPTEAPQTTPTTSGDCEDRMGERCKEFDQYYCNLYPDANKYWCAKSCFNCNV